MKLNRRFQFLIDPKWLLPLLLIALTAGVAIYYLFPAEPQRESDLPEEQGESHLNEGVYKIGRFNYTLEIVSSAEDRQKGLSDRLDLPALQGMLFIFETVDDYGIWMKDMNFALDIIWLNENQRVIGWTENVQPTSYPEVFRAETDSLYVVEINAGEVDRSGLQIGDYIRLVN